MSGILRSAPLARAQYFALRRPLQPAAGPGLRCLGTADGGNKRGNKRRNNQQRRNNNGRGRNGGGNGTMRAGRAAPSSAGQEKSNLANKIVEILMKSKNSAARGGAAAELFTPITKPPTRTFKEGVEKFRRKAASTSHARKTAKQALGSGDAGRRLDPQVVLHLRTYQKAIAWDEIPLDIRAPESHVLRNPQQRAARNSDSDAGATSAEDSLGVWGSGGSAPKSTLSAHGADRRKKKTPRGRKDRGGKAVVLDPRGLTLEKVSRAFKIEAEALVEALEGLGIHEDADGAPWGLASPLPVEDAELLCLELDLNVRFEEDRRRKAATAVALAPRPPIVSIMGHVDHGKTTLLDHLRGRARSGKSPESIAAGEAGGITQAISAFSVAVEGEGDGNRAEAVTFLDTPGHAAFTGMRASGANATDVAVVVCAADDGVKPQTEEVLQLLVEQRIPMVVAMTKIDREGVDVAEAIARVENGLIALDVLPEGAGGDVPVVPVSGVTGEGVDNLLEHLSLQAEMLDLAADPKARVDGWVLESGLNKALGPVATVLVKSGNVKAGDWVVAADVFGRVRFLLDGNDKQIKGSIGPGGTARVVGFPSVPASGQQLRGVADEGKAEALAERRRARQEREAMDESADIAAERQDEADDLRQAVVDGHRGRRRRLSSKVQELADAEAAPAATDEGPAKLKVVLKADAKGTLDALTGIVDALFEPEAATVEVVYAGVGDVSETDVATAREAEAPIAAFNVGFAAPAARAEATAAGVVMVKHNIIYHLAEALKGELKKIVEGASDRVLGAGEVLMVIELNAAGRQKKQVAGCRIDTGLFAHNDRVRVRVRRNGDIIAQNLRVESLKHFKKDVAELEAGNECGVGVQGFDAFIESDVVEVYEPKPKA